MQGVEIPYQESASSGATTIQFKNAVLSLKVTPLITPDNRIILDLDVRDDTVGTGDVASGGVTCPRSTRARSRLRCWSSDGQTVVLGGILETTQSRATTTRCPGSATSRSSGNLFKSTTNINNKDELLIFITPKIVREGVNVLN